MDSYPVTTANNGEELDEAVTPTSQSATSVYEVCARLADDMGQPAVAVAIRAVAKAAQKK